VRSDLSFCLLQIRNDGDPVKAEEHACFVRRLGVPASQVEAVDVLSQPLDERIYERFDALLVGGSGEYSVLDDVDPIRRFLDFLGVTAARGFPTFASCFGFQALSLALGGEVEHDEERAEVGTYEITLTPEGQRDPLFSRVLPERFYAQQGHKDHVTRLPSGAVHLAGSEKSPHQALRFGDGPVWATQFHPELAEEDNRARIMRYQARYANELEAVLSIMQPSPHTHDLLRTFAEQLGRDLAPSDRARVPA
jgi:GMP synthase (glutamine-hydrolysing)